MRVLDLFSGIGGFSLGLERAGFQTAAFCEINPFCQAVLRKHWPDVPIFADVRALSAESLAAAGIGTIDVICGGYPCQPFSAAGKRRGKADDRHLWPEMFRLICELRPDWVIGENVAGHITMGLDDVLFDLENAGYSARAFVIPACAVNAPHKRDRVWVVANAVGGRRSKQAEREMEQSRRAKAECSGQTVAHTECFRWPQVEQPVAFRPSSEEAASTAKHRSRAGGWKRWLVEPRVGRVADGVPNRVDRTQSLGNGLVSDIPEIIGQAIKAGLVI